MAKTGTYGYFGQAIYDHERKEWRFERSARTNHILRPLEEPKVVVPGTSTPCHLRTADGKEGPSRRREKQVKSLVQTCPEIQPASNILPGLARLSEAVEDAVARHDFAKGNLIAFSSIANEHDGSLVDVAAFPSGPTGSDLCIVQVQGQRRGWDDSRSAWLDVLTIYGKEAVWKGPGVSIQSIHFAPTLDSEAALLAVRLITCTLIFRPGLKEASNLGKTSLDINILFELRIGNTGGSSHADVTFNPWNPHQLAIVDQMGLWSVWELRGKQLGRGKRLYNGALVDTSDKPPRKLLDDGWHRITWVCSTIIIAVCNRRRLTFFNIDHGNLLELEHANVGLDNGVGWILDMAALPSQQSYICVLTSTHLFVFRINLGGNHDVQVQRLINIRHFRDEEDISLRLRVFNDGDDFVLLIRSDIAPTCISYRINFSHPDRLTIGDPTELTLPLAESHANRNPKILDLHVKQVSVDREHDGLSHSLGSRYLEQDVRFYSIVTLHNDLSVRQTLFFANTISGRAQNVQPPSWESKLIESVVGSSEDDFVVHDDETDGYDEGRDRYEPISTFVQQRRGQLKSRLGKDWTVNHEITMRQLNAIEVAEVTDIDEILEEAQRRLESGSVDDVVPMRTLRELAEGEITVRDVKEASAALETLRSAKLIKKETEESDGVEDQPEPNSRLTLRSLELPQSFGIFLADGSERLSSIHSRIIDNWILPLSEDVPDIARLSKETLARRMAAEVALAGQALRVEEVVEEQPTQSQSQNETWELPVRPQTGPASSRATPSVYFDASSQPQSSAQPTRSPSLAASGVTDTSHPSTFSAPETARLGRYTTFSSKPTTPLLPRRLKRVLGHWTLGADPEAYDWMGTSRHFSQRDDEEAEGDEMTEKERQRMQRRTERYIKRQRREVEESQRQQVLSSQAPEIVSASQRVGTTRADSQPVALAGESQSQSQSQNQELRPAMASQVLQGRHGGRPARKKRKSGF